MRSREEICNSLDSVEIDFELTRLSRDKGEHSLAWEPIEGGCLRIDTSWSMVEGQQKVVIRKEERQLTSQYTD